MIAEQLRHSDGGALVLELYGHPERDEAIRRIRDATDAHPRPCVLRCAATALG